VTPGTGLIDAGHAQRLVIHQNFETPVMIEALLKILTVVGLGAVHMFAAVPAGLAMGLPAVVVCAASAAGSILVLLVVVLLGEQAREFLLRRFGPTPGTPADREAQKGDKPPDGERSPEGGGRQYRWAMKIWERYGVIGLALIAPLFPGAPVAAALTLALGVPARRVFLWLSIGIILWTAGVTLATVLGFTGLQKLQIVP
jgi:uncharacterized membrane protein